MKKIFKRFFDKNKEDNILIYVNDLAYLCNDLNIKEDKDGKYIDVIANYNCYYKAWKFKKEKVYVDYCKVRYMDHNILKLYDNFIKRSI